MSEHNDFEHGFHEWEDDCIRTAGSPARAAAGLLLIAAFAAGLYLWHRRKRLIGLALLALLIPFLTWSCSAPRNAPKVKTQHHNAKPRGLGWGAHEARNEASR